MPSCSRVGKFTTRKRIFRNEIYLNDFWAKAADTVRLRKREMRVLLLVLIFAKVEQGVYDRFEFDIIIEMRKY